LISNYTDRATHSCNSAALTINFLASSYGTGK